MATRHCPWMIQKVMPLGGGAASLQLRVSGYSTALLPHRPVTFSQPLTKRATGLGSTQTGAGFCHPQHVSPLNVVPNRTGVWVRNTTYPREENVEGAAVPRALRGRALGRRGPLRECERRGSSSAVRRAASSSAAASTARPKARQRFTRSAAATALPGRAAAPASARPAAARARRRRRAGRAARPRRIRRTSARHRARGAVSTH